MGELRGSRRATHVGLRRHLPHQQLDVHLRAGVPGRPDRAGRRARARLLLVRRPLHRQGRPPARREDGRAAHARAVAVPQGRRRSGAARSRSTATATPSPGWSTAPASSSTGPASPAAPGCALHRAALEAGERFMDWKPEVCWQLPLRRVDDTDAYGHVTSTVREWKRRDWGEGGYEFHWWCTDDPEAFVGHQAGLPWRCATSSIELVGRKPYALFVGPRRGPHRQRTASRQRLDRHLPPPPGGPPVARRSTPRLAGEAAAVLLGEHPLADADGVGRDLDQLVLGDPLDRRLERVHLGAVRA